MKKNKRPVIVITGPTGSGKTALSHKLGQSLPIEIINADIGSFYQPMTIGTAKPDWRNEVVPHHMFDILNEPGSFDVAQYRTRCFELIQEIEARGNYPVIVGGSMFYIHSLFFPPRDSASQSCKQKIKGSWEQLKQLDPERAATIEPSDPYRIQRAIEIYQKTGQKPSTLQPKFCLPDREFHIIFVERDREELLERINKRTQIMVQEGWVEEVRALLGTPWQIFIERKKLIGYNEIVKFLSDDACHDIVAHDALVEAIQKRTRAYAKRQWTFWRRMRKMITREQENLGSKTIQLHELNLTLSDLDLYISSLKQSLLHEG
ncbi:tRNA (adenosine(37)-N6)-dimethylallyltransferase MiaA [bacterium]|jgi:tRNA dimethylallyltransferase|nr:tRNA (adenosine(37)-N6)-dimethylallyltransferase MiaA [bacterium]MBT4577434.1 tRNA (adenosine(37)-N6)-dimethylallyltransferase MiaA [bacterium]MBT5345981.1 tRNA (adenosine(37)-N6)-dimethylallyltransferase MiaA [bacterium]MBT6130767.1 tRNA (adenosine(37)-N6)-dimethylallyltransferase MiaA [bacterium]MBT6528603.1 tRNA (adenosine(37)-N6)-dimethylallyltransferase MiaA [bacterium]